MTTLNRLTFTELVSKVAPFTSVSAFIPILTHIALKEGLLSAFNDVQGIEIELEELQGLNCAVPGDALLKVLKTINTSDIEFVVDKNRTSMMLKFGRSKAKLSILPDEDFIYSFPEIANGERLNLSSTFLDAARLCLSSVSDVPGHPELNTLSITIEGHTVTLYSTDNKTLSRVVFENEEDLGLRKLVVPAQFFSQLIELASDELFETGIEVSYDDELMCVDFKNGIRLSTSLTRDQNTPDFEAIFEKQLPDLNRIVLAEPPAEVVSALERASVFSELKNQKFVAIEVDGTTLSLSSQSSLGNSDDKIEFGVDLGTFAFAVDPDTLSKAIARTTEIALLPNLMVGVKKTKYLEFTQLVSYAG